MIIHTYKDIYKLNERENPLLITFPFAGGNTYSYRIFFEQIEPKFDILSIELPGRSLRLQEEVLTEMSDIILDIWNNWFLNLSLPKEFIFWGHSMGGILAYNIALLLKQTNKREPRQLLISGCKSPLSDLDGRIHKENSDVFWDKMAERGGIPDKILECPDIKNFVESYFRADIQALETYENSKISKINIPMTILYGNEDNTIHYEQLLQWKELNCNSTNFQEMTGNHFFIFDNVDDLVMLIHQFIYSD